MVTPSGSAPTFDALGLHSRLTATLAALGYEEPTPVQRETIPLLLTGRDMLGIADNFARAIAAVPALPPVRSTGTWPAPRKNTPMIIIVYLFVVHSFP